MQFHKQSHVLCKVLGNDSAETSQGPSWSRILSNELSSTAGRDNISALIHSSQT